MSDETKDDTEYRLAPKGAVMLVVDDEQLADRIMEKLEIIARRTYPHGPPAIVWQNGRWDFVQLYEAPKEITEPATTEGVKDE